MEAINNQNGSLLRRIVNFTFGCLIGTAVTAGTFLYAIYKDKRQMIEKSKIVMCEIANIMQQKATKINEDSTLNQSLAAVDKIYSIDQTGLNEDVLDYLFAVRRYYSDVSSTMQNQRLGSVQLEEEIKIEVAKFYTLMKELTQLQQKYNIIINT